MSLKVINRKWLRYQFSTCARTVDICLSDEVRTIRRFV